MHSAPCGGPPVRALDAYPPCCAHCFPMSCCTLRVRLPATSPGSRHELRDPRPTHSWQRGIASARARGAAAPARVDADSRANKRPEHIVRRREVHTLPVFAHTHLPLFANVVNHLRQQQTRRQGGLLRRLSHGAEPRDRGGDCFQLQISLMLALPRRKFDSSKNGRGGSHHRLSPRSLT